MFQHSFYSVQHDPSHFDNNSQDMEPGEEETSLDTFHQKFELIRQINNFTLTHNSYSLSTTQRYDTDYDMIMYWLIKHWLDVPKILEN